MMRQIVIVWTILSFGLCFPSQTKTSCKADSTIKTGVLACAIHCSRCPTCVAFSTEGSLVCRLKRRGENITPEDFVLRGNVNYKIFELGGALEFDEHERLSFDESTVTVTPSRTGNTFTPSPDSSNSSMVSPNRHYSTLPSQDHSTSTTPPPVYCQLPLDLSSLSAHVETEGVCVNDGDMVPAGTWCHYKCKSNSDIEHKRLCLAYGFWNVPDSYISDLIC